MAGLEDGSTLRIPPADDYVTPAVSSDSESEEPPAISSPTKRVEVALSKLEKTLVRRLIEVGLHRSGVNNKHSYTLTDYLL